MSKLCWWNLAISSDSDRGKIRTYRSSEEKMAFEHLLIYFWFLSVCNNDSGSLKALHISKAFAPNFSCSCEPLCGLGMRAEIFFCHASNPKDRNSVMGYYFFLGGAITTWCSTRQKRVSTPTSKAKYVAMSRGVKEGVLDQLIPKWIDVQGRRQRNEPFGRQLNKLYFD